MICSMLSAVSVMSGLCSGATPQALSDKPPSFSITVAQKMINAHPGAPRPQCTGHRLAIERGCQVPLTRSCAAQCGLTSRVRRILPQGSRPPCGLQSAPGLRECRCGLHQHGRRHPELEDQPRPQCQSAAPRRQAHGHGYGVPAQVGPGNLLDADHRETTLDPRTRLFPKSERPALAESLVTR